MAAADALGDPGVLAPDPVLEFGGVAAVALRGGLAVVRWRAQHLRATAQGLPLLDAGHGLRPGWRQAVVHVVKGREAGEHDAARAEAMLEVGGRLVVCGDNDLGAASFIRRIGARLGQVPTLLAQRSHGRIAGFVRGPVQVLPMPPGREVPLAPPELADAFGGQAALQAGPGVFSADGLDDGTAALLACLAELAGAPRRVLDLGCGIGHLAIAALRRWTAAEADLADGDLTACDSATANLRRLGLAGRARVHWWDAAEAPPAGGADLVLCNPPFHTGVEVDYGPARAMFRAAAAASAPGSTWLVVANTRLPYEDDLRRHGDVRCRLQSGGFKVLEVRRG